MATAAPHFAVAGLPTHAGGELFGAQNLEVVNALSWRRPDVRREHLFETHARMKIAFSFSRIGDSFTRQVAPFTDAVANVRLKLCNAQYGPPDRMLYMLGRIAMAPVAGDRLIRECRRLVPVERIGNRERMAGMTQEALFRYGADVCGRAQIGIEIGRA